MTPGKNRYFIALVLPSPLFERVLEVKHYFQVHYHSKASLNSPPHITLHMPFEWNPEKESNLMAGINELSLQLGSVSLELRDFGCFAPRVIFINVTPSPSLTHMQKQVRQSSKRKFGLFNADYQERTFYPHVTVAFRDLKKPMFVKAWAEFEQKSFHGEFLADRIALLKHDGKKWEVHHEFLLPG